MKARKKWVGTRTGAMKERKRRIATVLAFILITAGVLSYFAYTRLNTSSDPTVNPASTQAKAAIIDQLSLTFPNQTFIDAVVEILHNANYTVDYYSGEEVTVEFYRTLPTYGYKIIILRVHSALGDNLKPPLALFTSEPYSRTKYGGEQLANQLVEVVYDSQNSSSIPYFGVWPEFIRNGMNGRFQKSVVFLMGCNGMTYNDTAAAFVDRGAGACIGWFGPVSAPHTDQTTTRLLQHFLVEEKTLQESTQETFREVGLDPSCVNMLSCFPKSAANQTIGNIERVGQSAG